MASADTEPLEAAAGAVGRASTLVLGLSGEEWDRWLLISIGVAAIVALMVGFCAAGSVVAHKREVQAAELLLQSHQQAVAAKVADAQNAGIKAGRDASDALARAAEANARAQEAGLQLEVERNRRLPRGIRDDHRAQLIAALETVPVGHVVVVSKPLDAEATHFADEIRESFAAAAFPLVTAAINGLAGVVDPGLKIIVRDSAHRPATAEPLVRALQKIGGDPYLTIDDLVPDDETVVIFVGRKPD